MFDHEPRSEKDLATLRNMLGERAFAELHKVAGEQLPESLAEAAAIFDPAVLQSDRQEQARQLLEQLIPGKVDVKLWRDLAAGKNVQLPASDQYGPLATRLAPSSPRASPSGQGNAYGKVHNKGKQEPSAFIRRQGELLKSRVNKIAELEAQLEEERNYAAEAEHGLKLYALTLLLTELRNATAPIFAMGPAWTVLRAIAGKIGDEQVVSDRQRDSTRIMVVLHALRDDARFHSAIKGALLQVCHRFSGAAAERGKGSDAWEGPHDYEEVLSWLGWPEQPNANAHGGIV